MKMKWVEILTLRSPGKIDRKLADEFLNGLNEYDRATDTPEHLVDIKIYSHSVVETDLSIHIHWESEKESQCKSTIGLRYASALKPLGLLNHSVWIETTALEFPADYDYGKNRLNDIVASTGSKARNGRLGGSS